MIRAGAAQPLEYGHFSRQYLDAVSRQALERQAVVFGRAAGRGVGHKNKLPMLFASLVKAAVPFALAQLALAVAYVLLVLG